MKKEAYSRHVVIWYILRNFKKCILVVSFEIDFSKSSTVKTQFHM